MVEEDHARRPRKALLTPVEDAPHGLTVMGDFNHTMLVEEADELVVHVFCFAHDVLILK